MTDLLASKPGVENAPAVQLLAKVGWVPGVCPEWSAPHATASSHTARRVQQTRLSLSRFQLPARPESADYGHPKPTHSHRCRGTATSACIELPAACHTRR